LNQKWKVNARHPLYREDGIWYRLLERFPGALFDKMDIYYSIRKRNIKVIAENILKVKKKYLFQ